MSSPLNKDDLAGDFLLMLSNFVADERIRLLVRQADMLLDVCNGTDDERIKQLANYIIRRLMADAARIVASILDQSELPQ